jgi:hypothetical protein
MPAKKSTKNTVQASKHDSDTDYESLSSDDEQQNLTMNKKKVQSAKKNTNAKTVDNDSSSDDEPTQKTMVNKKVKTTNIKAETLEDDSEDIEDVSDHESESETVSETETETGDKKSKEKKMKETFDELSKKLDVLQLNIKTIDKEILEIEKSLKSKEKIRNDYERQRNSLLKLLSKTHNDEVTKARKEKPKRKGNVNGGFCKEHPVPDVLVKFLELKEGETCLARHQVMSKLSNKFSQMGLKKGQDTTLNKEVVKELELDKSNIDRVIKFGEFQTFLKGFYPTKEEKNTVSVN